MKHFLLTIMVLFAAGTAMASNYFYIDDFEVDPSSVHQMTVPVKAHFDGRLNGFEVNITYPEGITPVEAVAGSGLTVQYLDKYEQNQTKAIALNKNTELTRFISFISVAGYWNGPNGFETYGAVKWEAGDYDEMFFLTLQIDENFAGGNIEIDTQVSSSSDARGGTINSPDYGSSTCHVTTMQEPIVVDTNNYFYIDNFEVDPSNTRQITVPVKAHFEGRLNAFELNITYPAGITPIGAYAGSDMTVSYMDEDAQNQTRSIKLNKNDELTRFIAAIDEAGYWYGPNGFEMYGAVKWEAGEYDEMFFLTLQIDENFAGGEIQLETQVSSGSDTRGGTVGRLAYGSSTCLVSTVSVPIVVGTDHYFYIDDFEVDPSNGQITVPVKAHFEGRLNAFDLTITYPEGITPVRAVAGSDMTVSYMDQNGQNQTKSIKLNKNDEITRFIGAIDVGGYWYGPNGFEMYGAVKWEPGEYDEMFFLTLQIDQNFAGGDILLNTEVSSGNDTRGGTVGRQAFGSSMCHVTSTSLPIEVTPDPIISYDDETATVTVWSDMDNALLKVYINGELINEDYGTFTYQFTRTDQDQEYEVVAIAQVDGWEPSNNVVYTIVVAAAAVEPEPEPTNNSLNLADAEVVSGNTVVIPLLMTNVDQMTAFQTDICLPEGFELLKQNGDFVIETSGRLSDHIVMANTRPDGSVRIMCYSPALSPIVGNEGELLYVTVVVPAGAEGEYTLTLKNNVMTTMTFEEVRAAETYSTLYVQPYIYGDADNSGNVTVTDVVVAARYVLGYEVDNFVFGAADMNGDGDITVTDVVLIARQVLYPQGYSLMRAPAFGASDDMMSAEGINLPAGETRTVTIALDNYLNYTAFQLDMLLPDGLTASNFCLTNRAGSHALDANTLADGTLRVICYSPELAAINGHEGALLTFDVTAAGNVNGNINVDGIEMVTTTFQTIYLDAFAIGVNTVSAVNEMAAATRIYSDGHNIIVESPVAQVLTVCDMAGRAQQVKVIAGHNVIPAPGTGVYIVSARDNNAKLLLK